MKYSLKGLIIKFRRTEQFVKYRFLGFILLMKGNTRKSVYWWHDMSNFGDSYNFYLLKSYGFAPILVSPNNAEIICTGSIIEHIKPSYSGIIMGSGFLYSNSVSITINSNILALRGKYSLEKFTLNKKPVLGDPGLLAFRLLKKEIKSKYVLGVVLNFEDYKSITKNSYFNSPDVLVINPKQSPAKVIEQISSCKHIVSSSLHGLIFSDSLNIPNKWITVNQIEGSFFKFQDYYSALDLIESPIHLQNYSNISDLINETFLKPISSIDKVKKLLNDLFVQIPK